MKIVFSASILVGLLLNSCESNFKADNIKNEELTTIQFSGNGKDSVKVTGTNCKFKILEITREYLPNKSTNIFCSISDSFNDSDSDCWHILGESFFNLPNDSLTEFRKIYYVKQNARKFTKISSLEDILNNKELKRSVIFEGYSDTINEKDILKKYPFR